jgi:hypothetical protein
VQASIKEERRTCCCCWWCSCTVLEADLVFTIVCWFFFFLFEGAVDFGVTSAAAVAVQELRADRLLFPVDLLLLLLLMFLQGGLVATSFEITNDSQVIINLSGGGGGAKELVTAGTGYYCTAKECEASKDCRKAETRFFHWVCAR